LLDYRIGSFLIYLSLVVVLDALVKSGFENKLVADGSLNVTGVLM
jgi:hypothetical protein